MKEIKYKAGDTIYTYSFEEMLMKHKMGEIEKDFYVGKDDCWHEFRGKIFTIKNVIHNNDDNEIVYEFEDYEGTENPGGRWFGIEFKYSIEYKLKLLDDVE